MLSLGVLFYNLFPGPQHLVHGIYYLLRAYFTENVSRKVHFPGMGYTVERFRDAWCIPIVTLMLTIPQPSCGDFVFVPYVIVHTMGYGAPVWFSVLVGAFFTVYVFLRYQVVYMCIAALASRYIRGDNQRLGLMIAGSLHLIMAAFEPLHFNIVSVCIVLFMAEYKLRMRWEWEWVPPLYPAANMLAAPVYIMNMFVWGWAHRWKYTDKVWTSMDIVYPVANIIGGFLLHTGYIWSPLYT